jgi:hypothetical protein
MMLKASIWRFVAIALICAGATACDSGNNKPHQAARSTAPDPDSSTDPESKSEISRDDAISDHWGEIRPHLNGSETVEACSSESGNCYDLEADISDGAIDTIHFQNGGYLSFSAEIDSDGSASDSDKDGNDWDFTLDMNSSIVDEAISQWASENDYTIQ